MTVTINDDMATYVVAMTTLPANTGATGIDAVARFSHAWQYNLLALSSDSYRRAANYQPLQLQSSHPGVRDLCGNQHGGDRRHECH